MAEWNRYSRVGSDTWRDLRGPQNSPERAEALHADLRRATERDLSNPVAQRAAIESAWRLLAALELPNFGKIRERRAEEYPRIVAPAQHAAAALALYVVGWLEYAPSEQKLDRAAQMLHRAALLQPSDHLYVEAFAVIGRDITADHIVGLRGDSRRQAETATGYVMQSLRAVEHFLETLGFTRDAMCSEDGVLVTQAAARVDGQQQLLARRLLGLMAQLAMKEAVFFQNGKVASHAVAAACSHLQLLGLPRGISECVRMIREAISESGPGDALGDERDEVVTALESLSAAQYFKWERFNNHSAYRRSQLIDEVLELLDPRRPEGPSEASPPRA